MFANVKNTDLTAAMKTLVKDERQALGDFLLHLNEATKRGLHLELGWSSAFKYLMGEFNFSEPATAKRLAAARLIDRLPQSLPYIQTGKVHLTGIYILAKHLKEENCQSTLEACSGKSKSWIEEYVAKNFLTSTPVVKRDVVRILPPFSQAVVQEPLSVPAQKIETVNSVVEEAGILPLAFPTSEETETDVRLSVTLNRKTYEQLKRLQEILGKETFGEVIEKACEHLQEKIDPLKIVSKRDLKPSSNENSRYVPKAIKVQVYKENNGQCAFVSKSGQRCNERKFLQLDHIRPFALGGKTELANLRLLCASHNQHMAKKYFGEKFVHNKILAGRFSKTKDVIV